jgi:hypothetical protein
MVAWLGLETITVHTTILTMQTMKGGGGLMHGEILFTVNT